MIKKKLCEKYYFVPLNYVILYHWTIFIVQWYKIKFFTQFFFIIFNVYIKEAKSIKNTIVVTCQFGMKPSIYEIDSVRLDIE